jgi:phage terminase small subunit
MKLTPKQKAFADYYIELGNATEAYLKAGYKAEKRHVAEANARKLLGNYSVKKYIEERMKELESERIAKQDEILSFLTQVMRGEATERIPIVGKDFFEMVDNTPSIKDRVKAAELLGKRYALWTEKQQVEVTTPVFVDDVPEDD